jgi:hypothetical protein
MSQAPGVLYIVKRKDDSQGVQGREECGLAAAFATREQAQAWRQECEEPLLRLGDREPLLQRTNSLDDLLKLTAFDPPVFLDWLTDHGVPAPPEETTNPSLRRVRYERWLLSLGPQHLVDVYRALHHFHFLDIVEVPLVDGDYPPEQWEEWEHFAIQEEPWPADLDESEWTAPVDPGVADGPPPGWNDDIPF